MKIQKESLLRSGNGNWKEPRNGDRQLCIENSEGVSNEKVDSSEIIFLSGVFFVYLLVFFLLIFFLLFYFFP